MRKVALISSVCALALTGMSLAQEAPKAESPKAPVIALGPGAQMKEASPEAKAMAVKMLEVTKKTAEVFSSITDKATAEAAVIKLKAMKEESKGLQENLMKLSQDDLGAAMMPHLQELMMISMTVNAGIQKLQQADYYGCEELKANIESAMKQASEMAPAEGPAM